ncbi:MAG: insulinase family protein [Phycisphaerales bacterium]|nr:insulinase family protein [Phycisphaerales bacterium]
MILNRTLNSLMIGLGICIAVLGVGACEASAQAVDAQLLNEEVIHDQEGTRRIGLSNGLEIVVIPTNQYAQDDVQIWLIVRAGSMYELDDQRGSAMVLERLIRAGTKNFTPDEIDELLTDQEYGLGHYQGSFVAPDHAAFMAQVHMGDDDGIERVMSFFGDVLGQGTLQVDNKQIEQEISTLAESIANDPSPDTRSRRVWLPKLLGGTRFGERFPQASIQELSRLTPDQVRAFGSSAYHPGQATLIVIGPVDPKAIETQAAKSLGSIARRNPSTTIDGRMKNDVSMRCVLHEDPGFELEQAAAVWFRDREYASDDLRSQSWSAKAGRFTNQDMKKTVLSRVAGEIVRHRLARQSTQVLGAQSEVEVDQIDLFGQIDVLQIGIDSSQGQWDQSIKFIVKECDRLSRDGAAADEVSRARRSLLARWHRDADDWTGLANSDRIGLVHWQVTTGRPMIDMVRWDQLTTDIMSQFSDDEVQRVVRQLVDTSQASYIALVAQREDGIDSSDVLRVVNDAMASPIDPIDPKWMEQLAESLIDSYPSSGLAGETNEIIEISQHAQSGVWDAKLRNGVELWVREMGSPNSQTKDNHASLHRIALRVTISGAGLGDGLGNGLGNTALSEDQRAAAIIAWNTPATESRGHRAILAYMGEHQLKVRATHEAGYVRLSVDAPSESINQAMELAYTLLHRPLIEQDAFLDWQSERTQRPSDPVDNGLEAMYSNAPRRGVDAQNLTLDDAQRVLTQIVRNGQIDIAITGSLGSQQVLEDGSSLLGTLVKRERAQLNKPIAISNPSLLTSMQEAQVECKQVNESGLAVGFVGQVDRSLDSLRSMILASMVLSDQLKQRASAKGFDGSIRANVWTSSELEGREFLMVRVRCTQDQFSQARSIIEETIDQLIIDGITQEELAGVQTRLVKSIDHYFDSPEYWSLRLSMLGVNNRRVEDLWNIREGYSEIDAKQATLVLSELIASNERFLIKIVQPPAK